MWEVDELVSLVQLDRNRYYIESIFDVIKCLVLNELSLRGSSDDADLDNLDSGYSNVKLLSLLSYIIEKNPQLKSVVKTIPDYAKYTSHEIQNNTSKICNHRKGTDCFDDKEQLLQHVDVEMWLNSWQK